MRTVWVEHNSNQVLLGRAGESSARQVRWVGVAAEWKRLYGAGTISGVAKRSGDTAPYPVAVSESDTGGDILWTVSAADTAKAGYGAVELIYTGTDGVVAKSRTWDTMVLLSLSGDAPIDPPEPQQSWVDAVLEAASDAQASAERAESAAAHSPIIGEDGRWRVWDAEKGAYVGTGVEAQGPQGEGVPAVSVADDGKFLRVVGGAWAAVEVENAAGGAF